MQEYAHVESLLLAKLRNLADGVLSYSHEAGSENSKQLRTHEVDSIMKGLETFKDFAGVLELQAKLRKWMTDHNKLLVQGDLYQFAHEAAAAQVADLDELEKLMAKCRNTKFPKGDPAFSLIVVGLANNALGGIFTQVACLEP